MVDFLRVIIIGNRTWFQQPPFHTRASEIRGKGDLVKIIAPTSPVVRVGTSGCFDYELHAGHIELLEYAFAQGTHLFVFVAADRIIESTKHRKAHYIQSRRAQNLESLDIVEQAVLLPDGYEECQRSICTFGLDVFVFGNDQDSVWNQELQWSLSSIGVKTRRKPWRNSLSTTDLLRKGGLLFEFD